MSFLVRPLLPEQLTATRTGATASELQDARTMLDCASGIHNHIGEADRCRAERSSRGRNRRRGAKTYSQRPIETWVTKSKSAVVVDVRRTIHSLGIGTYDKSPPDKPNRPAPERTL